ncbi:RNA polymerase sigma factor [Aestuariibaculum sediminum]|uniref:Sigma-70 family RNA polymerase sigma factor n=1 Tax=Aestuariibaculum sediminum TaxID=2770637 RepID=A0A8J6U8E3_9FLAO|nr:sigma-70 family RNA polymerase sigma factor [Aestuariibaculum sediminum]MBD0831392.1 sigma-70 family RNA polymerase sigma factor [Aestuariibaculum sediminum]
MNDNKILELFKQGRRDKAFSKLYTLYPKIEALVLSKGGAKHDAADVFQEALIILHRNLEKSDFKLTASFYTYLYSVSRFVWKDMHSKFSKEELQQFNTQEVTYFHEVLEEKKYKHAERAFLELGKRCQQLLSLFYIEKLQFKAIAQHMQFKSEKIAKNQKYKCLKKAKETYSTMAAFSS